MTNEPSMHGAQILPLQTTSTAAAIPHRHGADVAAMRRVARGVRMSLRGPHEPSSQTWTQLGQALTEGDPLADDVAAWLSRTGMAQGRPLLERAINEGMDALPPDAPDALRRFMRAVEQMPDWLDWGLLEQGARFSRSTGLHGMRVLRDAGLMAGYQASAINQTLIQTGSLQRGAQRRMAETTSWWIDCTAQGGMQRQSAGFKNTVRVRVMHALVRRQVQQRPGWDAAQWGLPINQVDMQATYLGFCVAYLLALRATGVVVTSADAKSVMHLWRYTGWLMGVEPGLLFNDEYSARVGLFHNLLSQAPPDASSVALGRALMDEPLQRHYPWGASWRGPLNKAMHLSIVRLFVGAEGMRHLGLPPTLPWYPLMTLLPKLGWHGVNRLMPGGQARLARWGRAQQLAYLPILFGAARAQLAQPAEHG